MHTTRGELDRLYAVLEQHRNRAAVNAVKLLVWTGSRLGEVLGARWGEFDLARRQWHKPAERLKQKRASTIPLNPLALKLLREMHAARSGELLFPSSVDRTRPLTKLSGFLAGDPQAGRVADAPHSRPAPRIRDHGAGGGRTAHHHRAAAWAQQHRDDRSLCASLRPDAARGDREGGQAARRARGEA